MYVSCGRNVVFSRRGRNAKIIVFCLDESQASLVWVAEGIQGQDQGGILCTVLHRRESLDRQLFFFSPFFTHTSRCFSLPVERFIVGSFFSGETWAPSTSAGTYTWSVFGDGVWKPRLSFHRLIIHYDRRIKEKSPRVLDVVDDPL